MKKNKYIYIIQKYIVFALLLSAFACEKETALNIDANDTKTIVIEGMLTNESKQQEIKISQTTLSLNQEIVPVSNAIVRISDGSTIVNLIESPSNSGVYKTIGNYNTVLGKNYYLTVIYDGKTYTASTGVEKAMYFENMKYVKDNTNDRYHITWVAEQYLANRSAMYEIQLDWSDLPAFTNVDLSKCKARLLYYTLPTIDVTQVFAPDKQTVFFPLGTKVIEKRYSLTPDYTAYLRALMMETKWNGGLFDSATANLPTNIKGGAIGYFTAASVISSTFTIVP